jgi:predicted AAA+ superfamily ATPase
LLNQAVTQTLAGRIAITTLLPFSVSELTRARLLPKTLEQAVFYGGYPRVYTQKGDAQEWYQNYLRTYVERDIRQLKNVADLDLFKKFIGLCAGRIGQLLNVSSLANDCGITMSTVKSWLSLLEASYIIFLLQPYHKNFSKRLIKSPKLYFYDTGLACSILGIEAPENVHNHYLRGGLVESFVLADLAKTMYNQGQEPRCYFWRDSIGHEVDGIIERGQRMLKIEVKASKTIQPHFFDNLDYLSQLAKTDNADNYVIYAGDEQYKRTAGSVVSWKKSADILKS